MINSKNPQALAAVALFISAKETRDYLKGVSVEATGEITATDGKILASFKDGTLEYSGDDVIFPVPKEAIAALKKAAATGWQWDAGVLTVLSDKGNHSFLAPAIEGCNYPDWRKVLPDIDADNIKPMPAFQACNLDKFIKAATVLEGKEAPISIISSGWSGAAIIEIEGQPAFTGVIMPVRTEKSCKAEEAQRKARK